MVRATAVCRNAICDLSVFGAVEDCVRAVTTWKGCRLRRKEILGGNSFVSREDIRYQDICGREFGYA